MRWQDRYCSSGGENTNVPQIVAIFMLESGRDTVTHHQAYQTEFDVPGFAMCPYIDSKLHCIWCLGPPKSGAVELFDIPRLIDSVTPILFTCFCLFRMELPVRFGKSPCEIFTRALHHLHKIRGRCRTESCVGGA